MKVVIIGAGPAGLAAAGSVKADEILILEKNQKAGKKLYITGKGRCNVTNAAETKEFLENVVSNPKFLLSAVNSFGPSDTVNLIESSGVRTKTERGNRVFPESDKASDIIKALVRYAQSNNAGIMYDITVENAYKSGEKFCLQTSDNKILECDKLIIATGGVSYPATGSTGDGYKFAKKFGHNIVQPVPALVPIRLKNDVSALAGLSLKNVNVKAAGSGFSYSEFGEMLFTHNGVSGPSILTLSSLINRKDLNGSRIIVDLKPALSNEQLDKRILSDFESLKNKQFKNSLSELLPKSLIPYIIKCSGIDEDKPVNSITKAERSSLTEVLKNLTFEIDRLEVIDAAIVTAGGIDVKEISPKSMESKLVKGLFFAGEVIDVDAFTGGFNIQLAISTGIAAGKGASFEE